MPAEFDCGDCGAHVVQIVADEVPKVALCMQCIALPGWFNDPVLRKMLAPEYKPSRWRRIFEYMTGTKI
jgi:hypothetical protein